jgi:hypothetical protein
MTQMQVEVCKVGKTRVRRAAKKAIVHGPERNDVTPPAVGKDRNAPKTIAPSANARGDNNIRRVLSLLSPNTLPPNRRAASELDRPLENAPVLKLGHNTPSLGSPFSMQAPS